MQGLLERSIFLPHTVNNSELWEANKHKCDEKTELW